MNTTNDFDPEKINDDLILLKIFSYLTIKPLHKCMRVCKRWSCLVREAIAARKSHVQTFLLDYDGWSDESHVKHIIPTHVMTRSNFTAKTNAELDKLTTQPEIVILFHLTLENHLVKLNDTVQDSETTEEPKPKRVKKCEIKSGNLEHVREALNRYVFKKTRVLAVTCDGIIGTDIRQKRTVEIEETGDAVRLAGLAFPESDHFRFSIKPVDCSEKTTDSPRSETIRFKDKFSTEEELYKWLGVNQLTERLKLLFLFQAPMQSPGRHLPPSRFRRFISNLDTIRKTIGLSNSDNFVISGGVTQGLSPLDEHDSNSLTVLFLTERILRDEPNDQHHVQVGQIVIPDLGSIELMGDLWQEKVGTLKRNNPCFDRAHELSKGRRLFAVQVTCVARGRDFFGGEDNYESRLFQKSFPNVPIAGFFSQGELGMDFIYKRDQEKFKFPDHYYENSKQFAYTTVFTIFSLKS
jgi:hypothetical protein